MKIDKRKILGPLFPILSRWRHSPSARKLTEWIHFPLDFARYLANRPILFIETSGQKGLGALICEALLLHHGARQRGLEANIISFNPLYWSKSNQDLLAECFDTQVRSAMPRWRAMSYRTLHSWPFLRVERDMDFVEAAQLFTQHFCLIPSLQAIVEEHTPAGFDGFDISVHYRGTDKALEAPLVEFSRYFGAIRTTLQDLNVLEWPRIFLATDSMEFKRQFLVEFPKAAVSMYEIRLDGDFSRGRHFSSMSPADKAQEALVNIHLLARAKVCVRGASYLSACSALLNPSMKTVTLSRDHWGSDGFPEKQILAREQMVKTSP